MKRFAYWLIAAGLFAFGVRFLIPRAAEPLAAVIDALPSPPVPPKTSVAPSLHPAARAPAAAGEVPRELAALDACLESGDCDFPNSDSRAYELAVNRAIAARISELPPESNESQRVAREYIRRPDGFIKAEALKILAAADPSADSLRAILDGVFLAHDDTLVPDALAALAKYDSAEDRAAIDARILETLRSGSLHVAIATALELGKILYAGNLESYAGVARGMAADSRLRYLIEAAVATYRRTAQGG